MSDDLEKAINALTDELTRIAKREMEIKKTINQIRSLKGEPPAFTDVEFTPVMGEASIAPDQFFGKAFSTAVREYLHMKGRAATAQEIFEVLRKGGFTFPNNWNRKDWLKNVAITLSKNSRDFVPVPTSNGNAYGLFDFYPELKRNTKKKKSEKSLDNNNNKSEMIIDDKATIDNSNNLDEQHEDIMDEIKTEEN